MGTSQRRSWNRKNVLKNVDRVLLQSQKVDSILTQKNVRSVISFHSCTLKKVMRKVWWIFGTMFCSHWELFRPISVTFQFFQLKKHFFCVALVIKFCVVQAFWQCFDNYFSREIMVKPIFNLKISTWGFWGEKYS